MLESRYRLEQDSHHTKRGKFDLIVVNLFARGTYKPQGMLAWFESCLHSYRGYISFFFLQGCFQIGKALCMPPTAVLCGLISLTSYIISPAVVKVPNTEWCEPAIVWLSINMPTGSTKSALYNFLTSIILKVRAKCGYKKIDPVWLLGDATCEKMGDLMCANNARLLGLYDELTSFLTQLNLYRGKGLTMSHELALFLQLYNGHAWTRATGM